MVVPTAATVRCGSGAATEGILMDFDGILRLWTGAGDRAGAHAEGLPENAIPDAAYGTEEYEYAKLGILTDDEWRQSVVEKLQWRFDGRGEIAVHVWSRDRGTLVDGVHELIAALRGRYLLGLVTDGTDILWSDLRRHGLTDAFNSVFCSAHLGLTKPSPALYRHAAAVMAIPPEQILVIDDLAENLPGAIRVGMRVHHFTEPSLSRFVRERLL